jgi:hypothetical protein
MKSLRNLTVAELRKLARERIGPGHSKLKTKAQLLAALDRPAKSSAKPKREGIGAARRQPGPKKGKSTAPTRPPVLGLPSPEAAPRAGPVVKARKPPPSSPVEPLEKGFFIAPGAPPATPGASSAFDLQADLPAAYGTQTLVALPKDPTTLFLFWDFDLATGQAVARDLGAARIVLRLYDEMKLVREIDLNLEAGHLYLCDLPKDRAYRLEVHAIGESGKSSRIAVAESPLEMGVDSDASLRTARLSWSTPLSNLKAAKDRGEVTMAPVDPRWADRVAEKLSTSVLGTPGSESPAPGSPPAPRS